MRERRIPADGGWLAAAVLLCATAAAQAPPTAHEMAARVDRHYDELQSLKAAFTESYTGLGMGSAESGTLYLRKPGQMMWQYSAPKGKIFLLDGKFAWFYAKGDTQVQRVPANELDDLRSPLRFLLGRTQLEKEIRGLALAAAPNGCYTLTGAPRDQDRRVMRLALTVTAGGAITAIEIEEADGAITRFTFTDEEPNVSIPHAAFHFSPPPGVPVVDAPPPV